MNNDYGSQWFNSQLQRPFSDEVVPILSVCLHCLHQKLPDQVGPQWQHAETAAAPNLHLAFKFCQLMYNDNKKLGLLKKVLMLAQKWSFVTAASDQSKHMEGRNTLRWGGHMVSGLIKSHSGLSVVWEAGVSGSLISEVAAYGEARQLKPCLDQEGRTSQVRQAEHKNCAGMTSQTDDPDLCAPLTLRLPHADMGALIITTNTRQVFLILSLAWTLFLCNTGLRQIGSGSFFSLNGLGFDDTLLT